ncbi:hypothetical protein INF28_12555, partial [Oscillospiraceae bacterium DSM 107454]|nr:hypothetical protein [Ructibacterium gallinarum]
IQSAIRLGMAVRAADRFSSVEQLQNALNGQSTTWVPTTPEENIIQTPNPPSSEKKAVSKLLIAVSCCAILCCIAMLALMLYVMSGRQNTTANSSTTTAQTEAVQQETPAVTPVPTLIPTPTPAPTPTPHPVHTYDIIIDHISWDQANQNAALAGGHLVTFSDQEEFDHVLRLLSDSKYDGVRNVWIGACSPAGLTSPAQAQAYWASSQARWVTGEPFLFTKWREGEPSGYDARLGTEERFLQIFRPKVDGYVWSYNDSGEDLSEYRSGTLAYIIEYE